MIRITLLLCAVAIAAVCYGCVQPPPSPVRIRAAACDAHNPIAFLSKSYTLPSTYIPDPTDPNHTLPQGVQPVPEPYCSSLRDAYNFAAPWFQQQLDDLTATFILDDNTKCTDVTMCIQRSWGFRDYRTRKTFVALTSGLWTNGTLPVYSQYENWIVQALLTTSSPITINANPDTPTMTVLAALAHEMGHVKWWQYSAYSNPCHDYGGVLFADYTWPQRESRTPKWVMFGKERSVNVPEDPVDKNKLRNTLLASQRYSSPVSRRKYSPLVIHDLNKIYDGKWASIFATVSPDEDFVETYVLAALIPAMQAAAKSQNQTASLTITIPGQSSAFDLMYDFTHPTPPTPPTPPVHFKLYDKGQ